MSAIITSKFRLDTTNKFVSSLADNQFYMALGRPNAWTDDTTPTVPYENDYTSNTLWENMFAMKRLDATDIVHSSPRNLWVSGTTYIEYDDQDVNIESKVYFVISENNNVYICLKAGGGTSSVNPDVLGVITTGVHATGADGYVWKYMFTIPNADVTKFLTSSFIPVRRITAAPAAGSDAALINQWSVQEAAVAGAIYNLKITTAGTGYANGTTEAILTIVGDGTGATATAIVAGGIITGTTITAPGSGYTHATVTVAGTGASGALRPVISPAGGFGADPTNDLRSHYVTVNKAFTGDESASIPDANDFRQIAILKNPTTLAANSAAISGAASMVIGQFYKILTLGNSSAANWATAGAPADYVVGTVFKAIAVTSTGTGTVGAIASANAYNTCSSLTVAGNAFTADQIIEGTVTGAKGMVVEHTGGVISYIQNEATGFGVFNHATDNVRVDGTSVAGTDITAQAAPLINHQSGDVMFVENRTATTRADGQVETVRLVIAF